MQLAAYVAAAAFEPELAIVHACKPGSQAAGC